MNVAGVMSNQSGQPLGRSMDSRTFTAGADGAWSFVYIFFTNGIPFDAPNRSEPCPQL